MQIDYGFAGRSDRFLPASVALLLGYGCDVTVQLLSYGCDLSVDGHHDARGDDDHGDDDDHGLQS